MNVMRAYSRWLYARAQSGSGVDVEAIGDDRRQAKKEGLKVEDGGSLGARSRRADCGTRQISSVRKLRSCRCGGSRGDSNGND